MNTFGHNLRLTTFGESHGPAMGGIIDGFPPGIKIDFDFILEELKKRKPGESLLVTQRKESDYPEFLSGISEDGITLGTPIGFIIRNNDQRSHDYSEIAHKYRPNHADFTYDMKYGIRDYRGGGRASARETVNWVVAGAFAQLLLQAYKISVSAILSGAGSVSFSKKIINKLSFNPSQDLHFEGIDEYESLINEEIIKAKNEGDSVGGSVTCLIKGLKAGIGNPIFDKLQARLGAAMMSINAAKGFEYGIGMRASKRKGLETVDIFQIKEGEVSTQTNYSGGIQGGISNGMPIFFNVAFKPTPTLMKELPTLSDTKEETILKMRGRHDPCVAVRAVSVVKALTALVVADFLV